MSYFNYNAKANNRSGEYKIDPHDLEFLEINSSAWTEKSEPPYDLCRYLMEMVELRLGDVLDLGSRKRLAASILNMNSFQFSDYLFKANSENNRQLDRSGLKMSLNSLQNSDREKHRKAEEHKLGRPISPRAHKLSYKKNYSKIRKDELTKSISAERLETVKKIIQDYEESAVDCLSLIRNESSGICAIGSSKLGGQADMLVEDLYPIANDGTDMILLVQINISDAYRLLPSRFPKKKGLLLFFGADEELAGQRDHPICIRYYPEIEKLKRKVHPRSKSYNETLLELEINKSLPIEPWRAFEIFTEKIGKEIDFYYEFVQGKYRANDAMLAFTDNIEMRALIQRGIDVSDQIERFIPLLSLSSQYQKGADKPMTFGDDGQIGFFIESKDWEKWDFNNVAFTTYN